MPTLPRSLGSAGPRADTGSRRADGALTSDTASPATNSRSRCRTSSNVQIGQIGRPSPYSACNFMNSASDRSSMRGMFPSCPHLFACATSPTGETGPDAAAAVYRECRQHYGMRSHAPLLAADLGSSWRQSNQRLATTGHATHQNRNTSSGFNCSKTRHHHFQRRLRQSRRASAGIPVATTCASPSINTPHQSGIGRLHAVLDRTRNPHEQQAGHDQSSGYQASYISCLAGRPPPVVAQRSSSHRTQLSSCPSRLRRPCSVITQGRSTYGGSWRTC